MKLYQIQSAEVGNCIYLRQVLVNKESDYLYEGGQPADYFGGLIGKDVARGLVKKHEAKSIGPGFDRHQGVFQIGYAADFYFYHRESGVRSQESGVRSRK